MGFQDYFSGHAADYVRFRPCYPAVLFEHLATLTPHHDRAWDCATGNGQAAVGLANHFAEVIATDASPAQLAHAIPHSRVHYATMPAERTSLEPHSIDLIAVANALHWLDLSRFYDEVRRVVKPGGIFAAVWYIGSRCIVHPPVDAIVHTFYWDTIYPYWPMARCHLDSDFLDVPFPAPELPVPSIVLTMDWGLTQLLGYIGTWSAVKQFEQCHHRSPLDQIRAALTEAWGDPDTPRRVHFPLIVRTARLP